MRLRNLPASSSVDTYLLLLLLLLLPPAMLVLVKLRPERRRQRKQPSPEFSVRYVVKYVSVSQFVVFHLRQKPPQANVKTLLGIRLDFFPEFLLVKIKTGKQECSRRFITNRKEDTRVRMSAIFQCQKLLLKPKLHINRFAAFYL